MVVFDDKNRIPSNTPNNWLNLGKIVFDEKNRIPSNTVDKYSMKWSFFLT